MKKIICITLGLMVVSLLFACHSEGKQEHVKTNSKIIDQADSSDSKKVNSFEAKLIKKWQIYYSQKREDQLKDENISAQEKPYIVEKYKKEKEVIINFESGGKGQMTFETQIMPFTWESQYDNKYVQVKIQGSEVKFELLKVSESEIEWINEGFVERLKLVE